METSMVNVGVTKLVITRFRVKCMWAFYGQVTVV